MAHQIRFRSMFHIVVVLLFALAFGAAAAAQQQQTSTDVAPGSAEPTSLLRGGPFGELMLVFSPRNQEDTERRLEFARFMRDSAEQEYKESTRLADLADGRVRIMEEELETTKTRLDVAKDAKNEVERVNLETEVRRQEAEKKYLERLRDASRADAEWLENQRDAAAASVKALELESRAAKRHAELSAASVVSAADRADYSNLLREMLKAREEAGKLASEAASKQEDAAKRKLRQLDALAEVKGS